jgi:hypothetical protein
MATRAVTITPADTGRAAYAVWTGLANGDDGTPITMLEFADRSVQVVGTFGAAGSIRLEWSNDGGTTWVTCTDPQGNDIIKTAAGGESVTEVGRLVRPRVTAGDGTTALACHMLLRKTR